MRRITLFLLLFLGAQVSAVDVAIFSVDLTNLTSSQGDALGAVMVQQYSDISGQDVIGPPNISADFAENNSDPLKTAEYLEVKEYIVINAVALETKILVEALRYDISGKEIARSQMTTSSIDECSSILENMAKVLYGKVGSRETMELQYGEEINGVKHKKAEYDKIVGIKVGMFQPSLQIWDMSLLLHLVFI